MIKRVSFLSRCPRFYGVAWVDYPCEYMVLMPVPLNIIAGALRRFWFALANGIRPHELERLRHKIELLKDQSKHHAERAERLWQEVKQLRRLESNEGLRTMYNFGISNQRIRDSLHEILETTDETLLSPPD